MFWWFIEALSTISRIFLKTEIFMSFSLLSTRKRRFRVLKMKVFENGPQNGDFENAGLSFSCGRTKTEVFEYNVIDLVQSIPEWKIKMADRQLVSLLLGHLSSLIACIQLHFMLLNLQADYVRKRLNIIRLLSAPVSRTGAVKRLKRRLASFTTEILGQTRRNECMAGKFCEPNCCTRRMEGEF